MSLDETLDRLGVSARKREILELNHTHLMPNRVELWAGAGVPLVIGRREGYRLWDLDGHELQDLHLNGGTYNLGHRHPEMVAALGEALETLDVGNHHFPSEARGRLAESLSGSRRSANPWGSPLQRQVAVLLRRHALPLAAQLT